MKEMRGEFGPQCEGHCIKPLEPEKRRKMNSTKCIQYTLHLKSIDS